MQHEPYIYINSSPGKKCNIYLIFAYSDIIIVYSYYMIYKIEKNLYIFVCNNKMKCLISIQKSF
jgi:hypothetical protein